MKRLLSLVFIPAFWLCLIAYFVILFSVKINPQVVPILAISGLVFPFLFILFFFLTLAQGLLGNTISLIVGVAILFLTISTWKPLWGWSKNKTPETYDLKVMSYNVRNFDLYNWSNNVAARQTIMDIIKEENPDILCLQEFFSDEGRALDNIQFLKQKLGYKYYYFTRELIKSDTRQWGIATFSKYPILSKKNILKQAHPSAYGNYPYKGIITEILVNSDTFSVINVHLQSVFLDDQDYETLKKLTEERSWDLKENMPIVRKLVLAFQRRANQIEDLFIETLTLNKRTILCGDFNDTPISYTYKKITKEFTDVFPATGSGWGATYNRFFPGLRVDYIMLSDDLEAINSYTIPDKTSDHNPLVTYIQKN